MSYDRTSKLRFKQNYIKYILKNEKRDPSPTAQDDTCADGANGKNENGKWRLNWRRRISAYP